MKIVCKGKVYDLNYSETWKVCDLPHEWANELGHQHEVHRELRRTKVIKDSKRTGDFFVLEMVDGDRYYRNRVKVTPISPDEAAEIAEKYVDYDTYVEFFGDPRGVEAENEEKVRTAETGRKEAESSRDYWCREHEKVSKERDELKARLDEIQAKLDEFVHGAGAAVPKKEVEPGSGNTDADVF